MKKSILGIISLTLIIAYIFYNETTNSVKIAYIDNSKVIQGYEGTKNVAADFSVQLDTWQANLDTLEIELNQLMKRYEKDKNQLSSSEHKTLVAEINKKQQEYGQYQQLVEKKKYEENEKATSEVILEVVNFIENYGRKNNYDLILGKNLNGNIIYGKEVKDISDQIITELNKEYLSRK